MLPKYFLATVELITAELKSSNGFFLTPAKTGNEKTLKNSGSTSEISSVKGGFGGAIEISNTGTETLNDIPVEVVVFGGILGKINVKIEETISVLEPGETVSVKTGILLGLGKIAIGVIADDVVSYNKGFQLLILTVV